MEIETENKKSWWHHFWSNFEVESTEVLEPATICSLNRQKFSTQTTHSTQFLFSQLLLPWQVERESKEREMEKRETLTPPSHILISHLSYGDTEMACHSISFQDIKDSYVKQECHPLRNQKGLTICIIMSHSQGIFANQNKIPNHCAKFFLKLSL